MQIWLGILVIIVMIYLLAKRYETRMVLFGAGMAMALIAGQPMGAFARVGREKPPAEHKKQRHVE